MFLGNNHRSDVRSPLSQRRPDTANNAISSSRYNNNNNNNNTLSSANLSSPTSTRQQRASFESPIRAIGTLSRQQSINNTTTTTTTTNNNNLMHNNQMVLMEGLNESDLNDYGGGPLRLPPRPASAFNVTRPGRLLPARFHLND